MITDIVLSGDLTPECPVFIPTASAVVVHHHPNTFLTWGNVITFQLLSLPPGVLVRETAEFPESPVEP